MFSWALPKSPFMIMPAHDVTIFPSASDGKACSSPGKLRRRDADVVESHVNATSFSSATSSRSRLSKRATRYGPLVPRIDGLMCPGEVDLSDIPSCEACEGDDSNALQKRDDEVCWIDPYRSGEARCPAESESSNARRASHVRSVLEPRATKEPVKWAHNGGELKLEFPTYKSCGTAQAVSAIQRWYGYPKKQPAASACEAKLEKLNANQVDTDEFVTEHVYEAQLMRQFFEWLLRGRLPAGYANPTRDWVSEVLLGGKAITQPNRVFKHSSWKHDMLWDEMAMGLGSDDHPKLLVLADRTMNGRKKNIFAGEDISASNEISNQATRRAQRNYAGVFYYMRRDDIWSKFTETSQHMELVLAEFDEQYPWTTSKHINTGQPDIPSRASGEPTAGLRDLYCFWIESLLTNIEASASSWLTATTANYKSAFEGEPNGKKWLDNVLRPGGLISASILKFPKAAFTHSRPNPSQPDIWTQSNFKDLWDSGTGAAGPF
ncbi:hypothetical protein NM208_g1045 [Fusarium decemcellulare]|uniref:Uncharacterized protein n=1 Tax=Fusarium decemcellulare TaxID=57161 RepID=A0ACC1SXK4_9HYPO|nr:hypothetical protein NM208_g1045 [Fusarium decemcellulare]